MAGSNYLAFELTIAGTFEEGFTVQASTQDGGSKEIRLVLPWSASELEERVGILSDEAAGLKRGSGSNESRIDAKGFGANLFDAIFRGGVRDLLRSSQSRRDYTGVRIRLRLDAPALADVPWEYLFDEEGERFLALSRTTPIVRTFNLTTPVRSPIVTDQLNVLVMVSGAGGDDLATEAEFAELESALSGELTIQITRAPRATLSALADELRRGEFHVFHFIGHGHYDDRTTTGELLFEDDDGGAVGVSADSLAVHLGDHPSLRLIVLNACEGARTSVADPTSGLAQSLFTGGVEAVVAMQFEITDAAALAFSRQMYRSVGAREPIERAVTEARKAIPIEGNEWATPVVFMRSSDGQLFDEKESPELETPEAESDEKGLNEAELPETELAETDTTEPASAEMDPGERAVLSSAEPPKLMSAKSRLPLAVAVAALSIAVAGGAFFATRGGSDDNSASTTELQRDEEPEPPPPTASTTTSAARPDAAPPDTAPDTAAPAPAVPDGGHREEPDEPPFEGAVGWFDAMVGDCLDNLVAIDAGYDGDYWISVVSCTEAHDDSVFAVFDMGLQAFLDGDDEDNPWVGDDEIFERALAGCQTDFEAAELDSEGFSVDDVYPLTPTQDDWDAFERFFAVCLAR